MKHAYLIMAHTNLSMLEFLISSLDDPDHDIYIHLDKNSEFDDTSYFKDLVIYSNIFFTERNSVNWGGFSQIKAELTLYKAAYNSNNGYSYYHLLSGLDFPIRNNNHIKSFFTNSYPINYLSYKRAESLELDRIKYYFPLQDKIRNRNISKRVTKCFKVLQKYFFQIDRMNRLENITIYKGANWASLSDLAVKKLIEPKSLNYIHSIFRNGYLVDELYKQTILLNLTETNFKLENNDLRFIDWERGGPYTFKKNDVETIRNSNKLFVRKIADIEVAKSISSYFE